MTAQPADGRGRSGRPIATLLSFSFLGPLVGAFGTLLVVGVWSAILDGKPAMLLGPLFIVHPVAIVLAMMFGGLPALGTGLIALVAERRWPGSFTQHIFICLVAGFVLTDVWIATVMAADDATITLGSGIVFGMIGAFSAVACRWLPWRWRAGGPPPRGGGKAIPT